MGELSEAEIAEEAGFIEAHQVWPNWPILPVKHVNRGEPGHPKDEDCGMVFATIEGPLPQVVLMNMWNLQEEDGQKQYKSARRITFASIEAMVRAGWIGD